MRLTSMKKSENLFEVWLLFIFDFKPILALERNLSEERHYNTVARQELEKTSKVLE